MRQGGGRRDVWEDTELLEYLQRRALTQSLMGTNHVVNVLPAFEVFVVLFNGLRDVESLVVFFSMGALSSLDSAIQLGASGRQDE